MTDLIAEKDKDLVSKLIKIMLLVGLLAVSYVVLKACSTPKTGIERFATGSLSKLVKLDSAPAMPSYKFKGPDGQPISLQDLKGDILLVNIWATWCAPCVAELPSLNELAKNTADLNVVAISVDRTAEEAARFLKLNSVEHLPLYHDNTFGIAAPSALNAAGIPLTVIYNKSGVEVARIQGEADWQSEEGRQFISYILGE